MIMYTQIKRNSTHVIVLSTMQYIGFMATPSTKFYIQLRNPSDRYTSFFLQKTHFLTFEFSLSQSQKFFLSIIKYLLCLHNK